MGRFRQGTYEVKNKEKYVGVKNPRYMSSWELEVFKEFDRNPNVVNWGAEVIIVPYYSPVDAKNRRYMVDLYVEFKKDGKIITQLIEVKPSKELKAPTKRGRKKQATFLKEVYTWNVNNAKWAAAKIYAKDRGWTFRFLTEKDIFR